MSTPTPFAFLTRLPDAELTETIERAPGINIEAAWCGSNCTVNLLHGDKVPQRTYTVAVGGRGSLMFGEQEFRELLSSMIALFEKMGPGFLAARGATSFALADTLPTKDD